jgi:hypothetical protein
MGASADTNDASPSTVARCFLEPDLLAKALCVGADTPTWLVSVDPTLDELVALLVASRSAVTPAPRCLHAAASAPQEVQASLVDTSSPVTATQCTVDPPQSSPVQDTPSLMGQPVVVGAVAPRGDGEVWPPGFELAKHMVGTSTPT